MNGHNIGVAIYQFPKAVRFGIAFIFLTSCATVLLAQTRAANVEGWRKLDAGPFSILSPAGWAFHQLQGIDSYVGEFVGDGVVLTFDFGQYSSGYFKHDRPPTYSIARKYIG